MLYTQQTAIVQGSWQFLTGQGLQPGVDKIGMNKRDDENDF